MSLFRSLVFKNVILYLVIFLFGIGMIGYLLLSNSSKKILETAENQLVHTGDLVEIHLRDYIRNLISNMDYLSQSPVLERYLGNREHSNYQLLVQNYFTVIQSNNDFSQVRFISAKEGKELVRVDRKGEKVEIIATSDLQNKKEKEYFKEASQLKSTETYFSPINLNREFGKVSNPKIPTLRIARPVYYEEKLEGVVVINTNLTKLFERFKKTVGSDYILRMVNEEGFYLMHENIDSTFIFENVDSLLTPQVSYAINQERGESILSAQHELMSIKRVGITEVGYDFIYFVVANRSKLLSSYYEWRNKSLLIIVITAILFMMITFSILNRQSKTLRRLTDNMKQFPHKQQVSDLPVHRGDEIGDLAKGFEEMSTIINSQINSIKERKRIAEEAERDKSDFIENISHEIRNPLQSIMGLSTMLEQNNPTSNQIDILNSIKLNVSNLNSLVNSILHFQNIINDSPKVELSWTKLSHLINEIIIGNQYRASQKSIQIETISDKKLSKLEIKLDSLRMSQIINNLLINAITHTPVGGRISVNIEVIALVGKNVTVSFSIVDSGVGMSQEKLMRVTERYFTKKESQSLHSNFGLGLTIVNELLGQLGSEIKISSEKGIGSIFYFEIKTESRDLRENQFIKREEVKLKELNILLVDDDAQILNLYKHLFKACNITSAQDYTSITVQVEKQYDLIISDYRFKNSNVIDQLDRLQSLATKETLIVIVSGTEPDLSTVKEIFPNLMFFKKPFVNHHFLEAIGRGVITSKYGMPMLESIKMDYDYQEDKYTKAIALLINEWREYNNRLISSIKSKNTDEFEDILHKFNATLRRLKLDKFEQKLIEVKNQLASNSIHVDKEIEGIDFIMKSYLKYIQSVV